MSQIAVVTIKVVVTGLPGGPAFFTPAAVQIPSAVSIQGGSPVYPNALPNRFVLASGDNAIPVPANTVYIGVLPDPANPVEMILKGAVGDVGFPIDLVNPGIFPFVYPSGGTVYIHAGGVPASPIEVFFLTQP